MPNGVVLSFSTRCAKSIILSKDAAQALVAATLQLTSLGEEGHGINHKH